MSGAVTVTVVDYGLGNLHSVIKALSHLGAGVRLEYVGYDYDNRMLAGNTDEHGVPCTPTGCLYSRPADRRGLHPGQSAPLAPRRRRGAVHAPAAIRGG